MFRKMTTALALATLLMVAACNSVTGPAATGSTGGNGGGGGGERPRNELGKGVEHAPDEGGGGGGSTTPEPVYVAPGSHGPRVPVEYTPPTDDPNAGGGGGGGSDTRPVASTNRPARASDRSQH